MKHIKLGGLEVARIGLGAMGMSAYYTTGETNETESIKTIHQAIELGVTLIDTAEVYGPYTNEQLLGKALKGKRNQVVLATKFGLISHTNREYKGMDSKPANIRAAVEGSLKRLQTDHIDLYYQHRVDPYTPIEDTIGMLSILIQEGKINHIGLSEAAPATIRKAHAIHPIAALQSEYSLWVRDLEVEILPILQELHIGLVPYAPLGRGFLTGQLKSVSQIPNDDWRKNNPRFTAENFSKNLMIIKEIEAIADELSATPSQIALAWLLEQGDYIAPIPGTKRIDRVVENTAADQIKLNTVQLDKLNNLAPAIGERYEEMHMKSIEK